MTVEIQMQSDANANLTDAELDKLADQIAKYLTPIPMLPGGLHLRVTKVIIDGVPRGG